MKQSKFEKYSLWLVILWFIAIGALAFIFTSCSPAKRTDLVEVRTKLRVDSVEEIQPVSTLEFEPKFRMYLSDGKSVTVRNRSYAYNTDSVEIIYLVPVK